LARRATFTFTPGIAVDGSADITSVALPTSAFLAIPQLSPLPLPLFSTP
jgi:hypothetical protein